MKTGDELKVSVIIPTWNAEPWLERQLDCLLKQTVEAEVLVVDSGSRDATVRIAERYSGRVRLLRISRETFDHGGTRDDALRRSAGEFVLFLTQDALPAGNRYIETLLSPFRDPSVAAVFGRQTACPDAPAYERYIREFNYPNRKRVWGEEEIGHLGAKAYFFSDVCSAYRRSCYLSVGGFDHSCDISEDMLMAAKLLHAGWKLAYEPEAEVLHSHAPTVPGEYRRYVRIGRMTERYRGRLSGARFSSEGGHLVRSVAGKLLGQGKILPLAAFLLRMAARYAGFRTGIRQGKRERRKNEADRSALNV